MELQKSVLAGGKAVQCNKICRNYYTVTLKSASKGCDLGKAGLRDPASLLYAVARCTFVLDPPTHKATADKPRARRRQGHKICRNFER